MHHKGALNSLRTRLITNRASLGAVADEFIALQCDPLSAKPGTVYPNPLLLLSARIARRFIGNVSDRKKNMLVLFERQRLQRAQDSTFEHSFQVLHHKSIVAADRAVRGRWSISSEYDSPRHTSTPEIAGTAWDVTLSFVAACESRKSPALKRRARQWDNYAT